MDDRLSGGVFMIHYDEKTDGYRLTDNMGLEIHPGTALEVARGIMRSYENTNEEERIEKRKRYVESELKKRVYEYGNPFKEKEFRKDVKRHWGFTCSFCERKVSSKTDEKYYDLTSGFGSMINPEAAWKRTCSTSCAQKLVDEYVHEERIRLYKENGIPLVEA